MLNVTFYENEITNAGAPHKFEECHLETLQNGSGFFINDDSIVVFSENLPVLTDGTDMFFNSSIEFFSGDLSSLIDGSYMFSNTPLKSFTGCLRNLDKGKGMFTLTHITSFDENLSKLSNGSYMFADSAIQTYSGNLHHLINATGMFANTYITEFNEELPSLVIGDVMFHKSDIESFSIDLPNAVRTTSMFSHSPITSFYGDLSSLVSAKFMFYNTNLADFKGNLSSLLSAEGMFQRCKLSNQSLKFIADSIKDIKNVVSDINSTLDQNDLANIEKLNYSYQTLDDNGEVIEEYIPYDQIGYISIDTKENDSVTNKYLDMIQDKGWSIYVNGILRHSEYSDKIFAKYNKSWSYDNNFDILSDSRGTRFTKVMNNVALDNRIPVFSFSPKLSTVTNVSEGSGNGMFSMTGLMQFNSSLSSLQNGTNMFSYATILSNFDADLSSLVQGSYMFKCCYKLNDFTSDMPSLISGSQMFAYNTSLSSFSCDIQNLLCGTTMFSHNYSLESFTPTTSLNNLTNGQNMFQECQKLPSFDVDMTSLTTGYRMFSECCSLNDFKSNTSSLCDGEHMFYNCISLNQFKGDLSSLCNGMNMFTNCILSLSSLNTIADTIKDVQNLSGNYSYILHNQNGVSVTGSNSYKKTITIGYDPILLEDDVIIPIQKMNKKGWTVVANGVTYSPISVTTVSIANTNNWSITNNYASLADSSDHSIARIVDNTAYSNESDDSIMFRFQPNLSTIDGVEEGYGCFYALSIAEFNSKLTSLTNGYRMFNNCRYLKNFKSDLTNLTFGYQMFANNLELTSFDADLSNLRDGDYMFTSTGLTSWEIDMPSLETANSMMNGCHSLQNVNANFYNLISGKFMFSSSGITSFSGDLSNLSNGYHMFSNTSLTSFDSELPNLTDGSAMFSGCYLDVASVYNIVKSLPVRESLSTITISTKYARTDENRDAIAQRCNYDSYNDMYYTLLSYNWKLDLYLTGDEYLYTSDIYKYNSCTHYTSLSMIDEDYKSDTTPTGEWNYILDNLVCGDYLFGTTYNEGAGEQSTIITFNSSMKSLVSSWDMFYNSNLQDFNCELPSLKYGVYMFAGCDAITSFDTNLPALQDAAGMFHDCTNLVSFTSEIPNVISASGMFEFSYDLTDFNVPLTKLIDGSSMFKWCKLTAASVNNILSSLHTITQEEIDYVNNEWNVYDPNESFHRYSIYYIGHITLGVGYSESDANKATIASACGYSSWSELNDAMAAKNWTIQWFFNS